MKQLFDAISAANLTLPAAEVTLLIAILTFCLVFRMTRAGLVAAYLFVYRWGWIFFSDLSHEMLVGYMIFGCATGILTVLGMLQTHS